MNKKNTKLSKSTKTNILIGAFAVSQLGVALALQTDGKFNFSKGQTDVKLLNQSMAIEEFNNELSETQTRENNARNARIKAMIGDTNVFSTTTLAKEAHNYATVNGQDGSGMIYGQPGEVSLEFSKDGIAYSQFAQDLSNGDVLSARFTYGDSVSKSFSYTVNGLEPKEEELLHASEEDSEQLYSGDSASFNYDEFTTGINPNDEQAVHQMVEQAIARQRGDMSAFDFEHGSVFDSQSALYSSDDMFNHITDKNEVIHDGSKISPSEDNFLDNSLSHYAPIQNSDSMQRINFVSGIADSTEAYISDLMFEHFSHSNTQQLGALYFELYFVSNEGNSNAIGGPYHIKLNVDKSNAMGGVRTGEMFLMQHSRHDDVSSGMTHNSIELPG